MDLGTPVPPLYYPPVSADASAYTCPPSPAGDTCSLTALVPLPGLSAQRSFSPQHPLPPQGGLPDWDIYLYNKPGGQGTGGKGTAQGPGSLFLWPRGPYVALRPRRVGGEGQRLEVPDLSFPVDFSPGVACITVALVDEGGAPISLASWPPSSPGPPDSLQEDEFEQLTQVTRCSVVPDNSSGRTGGRGVSECRGNRDTLKQPRLSPAAPDGAPRLRLDVWGKGNISIVQLEEKLRAAARQALADAVMEFRLLPASLCSEDAASGMRAGQCCR